MDKRVVDDGLKNIKTKKSANYIAYCINMPNFVDEKLEYYE